MKIIERIKAFFTKKESTKPSPKEALKNSFGTPVNEPEIIEVGVNAEGKHYQATTRHVWVDGKWTARTTEKRVPKAPPAVAAPYTAATRRDAYNDSYARDDSSDVLMQAALVSALVSSPAPAPTYSYTAPSPCPEPEPERSSYNCPAPSPSYDYSSSSSSDSYSSSSSDSYSSSSSSSWD